MRSCHPRRHPHAHPHPHRASAARQRGVAAIEFALLLTLMISLIAGIFEFGRTFWYYDALSKATRNGARAVSSAAKASLGDSGVTIARAQVVADAVSAGVLGFDGDHVDIVCIYAGNAEAPCTNNSSPLGVRVSITGYTMNLGNVVPFLLGASSNYNIGLSPSTTMPYMK